MTNKSATKALLLLIATTAPVAALAQSAPVSPLSGLRACRAVTDTAARLACYDKAAADLETAVTQKNVVVLDREAVRQTRRSLFGFSLPKLPFFGDDDKDEEEEADEITATIASARSLGYGKWLIKLEDGAVWETTEELRGFKNPGPGVPVLIKRAALGSYMIRIADQRGVRAKRST